jgi:hypothetical protein
MRQPRHPHPLQRNGARLVIRRRTRSIHDRERERWIDAWHAGHAKVTGENIPDFAAGPPPDGAAASRCDSEMPPLPAVEEPTQKKVWNEFAE